MSTSVKTCQVRYTGGPLDGHRERVPAVQSSLGDVIAIPVNGNLLAMLTGNRCGPKRPATSVAVYELHVVEGLVEYQFLGPSTAEEMRLEYWTG
jgi:hypothetical protein